MLGFPGVLFLAHMFGNLVLERLGSWPLGKKIIYSSGDDDTCWILNCYNMYLNNS